LRGGEGLEIPARETPDGAAKGAAMTGTDVATYARERPGLSAFVLEDGVVYHSYSTYARGLDALWGVYQWLDRCPKGRKETGSGGIATTSTPRAEPQRLEARCTVKSVIALFRAQLQMPGQTWPGAA
jgi:Bacterial protein of unknown function (DUF899)